MGVSAGSETGRSRKKDEPIATPTHQGVWEDPTDKYITCLVYHEVKRMTRGDPYLDFLDHEFENEQWLKSRPECDCCGEHIQDEHYYRIDDTNYCEKCIEKFKREVMG